MAEDVIMPALGMSQETGVLLQWLKSEGELVAEGEPLMEIETDKVIVEVEATAPFLTGSIWSSDTAAASVNVSASAAGAEVTNEDHRQGPP